MALLARRTLRHAARRLVHSLLGLGQRLGVSILPVHWYSEVPNLRTLKATTAWRSAMPMTSISGAAVEDQVAAAKDLLDLAENAAALEVEETIYDEAAEAQGERGFSPIDARALFRFVFNTRPSRVIQVGGGLSTYVVLKAMECAGYQGRVVVLEPFPSAFLAAAARDGRIELHEEPAQHTPSTLFLELGVDDLLFVDSTHTTVPGSEVNRLILAILPMLEDGVWVHFHDIWLPYDYRPDILTDDLFFWRESLLLHAFLSMNSAYRLELSLALLHHDSQETLRELFPSYRPRAFEEGLQLENGNDFPVSCYIRRHGATGLPGHS